MTKLVTLSIKTQAADLRSETLDGRTYTVVPSTIIVAGVLNGELVPADELAFNPDGWNGRPIPLRHPQVNGDYVSANDPSIIGTQVVGTFFNAQFSGDRITGEMWLDTAKIERLGGDALATLERIKAGEIVEVSTGYFASYIEQSGEYNGKSYSAIQNSIVPDHIALLPDEIGACSVADGCGANRYNVDAADNHSNSVMVAFFLRPEDANPLALQSDNSCKCSQEDLEVADKEKEQAKVKKIANEEVAETPVATELVAVEAVAQYTLPAELTELAEAVRGFGGVGPLMEAVKGIKANADRQHADLVAKLTANAKCAFSADELKAMSLDALTKVQRMIAPVDYSGQAGFGLTANADSEEWEPYVAPTAAK